MARMVTLLYPFIENVMLSSCFYKVSPIKKLKIAQAVQCVVIGRSCCMFVDFGCGDVTTGGRSPNQPLAQVISVQ